MENRPIIIDCDPGLDDAIALVAAHKVKGIDVLGITTTAGNASLENTSKNALNILDAVGWEVPVIIGSDHPLTRERRLSNKRTGLGNVSLKESQRQFHSQDVTDFIYEKANEYSGQLEILALAPMTNIAKTILKYPDITSKIKSITFMGGAIKEGNITPSAEFNMYVDPNAAEIVFNSGVPLKMVGLDVTRKAYLLLEDVEYFKLFNNIHSQLVADLLSSIYDREYLFRENTIEIHDVVALSIMVFPELVQFRNFKVSIETKNKQYLGMLLFDYRNTEESNLNIAIDIDANKFRHWIKALIVKN